MLPHRRGWPGPHLRCICGLPECCGGHWLHPHHAHHSSRWATGLFQLTPLLQPECEASCDLQSIFIDLVATFPGSTHNVQIFTMSSLNNLLAARLKGKDWFQVSSYTGVGCLEEFGLWWLSLSPPQVTSYHLLPYCFCAMPGIHAQPSLLSNPHSQWVGNQPAEGLRAMQLLVVAKLFAVYAMLHNSHLTGADAAPTGGSLAWRQGEQASRTGNLDISDSFWFM